MREKGEKVNDCGVSVMKLRRMLNLFIGEGGE